MGAFLYLELGVVVLLLSCNTVCSLMSQVKQIGSDRMR